MELLCTGAPVRVYAMVLRGEGVGGNPFLNQEGSGGSPFPKRGEEGAPAARKRAWGDT